MKTFLLTQRKYGNDQYFNPAVVRQHFEYIESLPFDGFGIHSESGRLIMDGRLHTVEEIRADLAPLRGLQWKRMVNRKLIINVLPFSFGGWSENHLQSFKNLGFVIRDIGLHVFFDNEEYEDKTRAWKVWEHGVAAASNPDLEPFVEMAFSRGREMMMAMQSLYPELRTTVAISPSECFKGTPRFVYGWGGRSHILHGAFTEGLSAGSKTTITDGVECGYGWRDDQFGLATKWLREFYASSSPFTAASWGRMEISCPVFDTAYDGGDGVREVNPTIFTANIDFAKKSSDKEIWVYTEKGNPCIPGNYPQEYLDVLRASYSPATFEPAPSPGPVPVPTPAPSDLVKLTSRVASLETQVKTLTHALDRSINAMGTLSTAFNTAEKTLKGDAK